MFNRKAVTFLLSASLLDAHVVIKLQLRAFQLDARELDRLRSLCGFRKGRWIRKSIKRSFHE